MVSDTGRGPARVSHFLGWCWHAELDGLADRVRPTSLPEREAAAHSGRWGQFAPVRRGGAADVSFEIDALERSAGSVRRYASLSLPPLPLIVSYRSNKSLCGTAPLRTARPSQ